MVSVIPMVLCITTLSCCAFAELISEYAHHAVLDPEEKMKLYWTIDWDDESVSFAVEAETTGWVGLGFSSSGQMIGSDMVIGWVNDSKGYLTDRFAVAKEIPPIDEQQNYQLTGYEESGGKTLLKFKRKLDTCDPQDRKLEEGTTNVVFAFHSEDPASPTEMKYHEFRSSKAILLVNSMIKKHTNETGWKNFTFTTNNVEIPDQETTYWCRLIRSPVLNAKHHITKFEPYIQKGSEAFVHHLLIFQCDGNFTDEDYDKGVNCIESANMPFVKCRNAAVVAKWAVGAEAFYYPDHVGFPIGAKDSPQSYLLEIHYDNPRRVRGRKDSSGLRFYYTDKLRTYDAGVVSVGVRFNRWHIIPPKQDSWISVGYCVHQCTESLLRSTSLPGGGINIISAQLHTHLAGRAAWTKHVRSGKELAEIVRDDNYDFNFQNAQMLRKEIHIQPGDDLIQYCKYNTMDRDEEVQGGSSTRDEMCLVFLTYYPGIQELTQCQSTAVKPVYKFLDKYFDSSVDVPFIKRNPFIWRKTNWDQSMVEDLREYEDSVETILPECKRKYAKTVADMMSPNLTVPVPKITEPLRPKPSECTQAMEGPGNHACHVTYSALLLPFTLISCWIDT